MFQTCPFKSAFRIGLCYYHSCDSVVLNSALLALSYIKMMASQEFAETKEHDNSFPERIVWNNWLFLQLTGTLPKRFREEI